MAAPFYYSSITKGVKNCNDEKETCNAGHHGWFWLQPYRKDNAVAQADLKVLPKLWKEYPHSYLGASGEDVGLPDGQIGNSEVGHLNIGAGRIVYQALTKSPRTSKTALSFRNRLSSVLWKTSRKRIRPSICWASSLLAASTAANSISMVFWKWPSAMA